MNTKVEKLIQNWIRSFNKKEYHSPNEFAYYVIARGVLSKHHNSSLHIIEHLRRSFTPVSNKAKLDNGRRPYDTLKISLFYILILKKPLLDYVDQETHKKIVEIARECYKYV